MKLNNKGFAFSTMLYGTLAIITLVLYAILNIAKSSTDTTYYYGDIIRNKLNECVDEEIQLENCYSTISGTCDTTSYHACLGINDNTSTYTGIIASEKLKDLKVTSGDGLYEDSNSPRRYIYRGTTVNNYIQYSGKLWRIVSVESNGNLKLIDYSNPINIKWHNETNGASDNLEFKNSTLKNSLDSQYIRALTDMSKVTSGRWEAVLIYPSLSVSTHFSLNDYYTLKSNQVEESVFYSNVGILSIEDYMNASTTANCQANLLEATGCNSWIAEYKGWTINLNAEITSANVAYHFGTNNKLIEENVSSEIDVYPVIYLDRNIVIDGNGTISSPYIVR